jgi:hypothetical protein
MQCFSCVEYDHSHMQAYVQDIISGCAPLLENASSNITKPMGLLL